MQLKFNKLGILDQGDVKLSDLTIICGENNMGKTYVSYLIYCVMKNIPYFVRIEMGDAVKNLKEHGSFELNIKKNMSEDWNRIIKDALVKLKNNLPDMLAISNVDNLELELNFDYKEKWIQKEFSKTHYIGDANIVISKKADSEDVQIFLTYGERITGELFSKISSELDGFIEIIINQSILSSILSEEIFDTFIVSSERTGIAMFKNIFNIANSRHGMYSEGKIKNEKERLDLTISLPVQDNMEFMIQLNSIEKKKGDLYEKNKEEIDVRLEEIISGSYSVDKNGNVYYKPSKSRKKLQMNETSSSIKALLPIWYWIKHLASEGDMLIIDEPELNLHPKNQRLLARLLAYLVSKDIKVFITTHSDYIINEFNILIRIHENKNKLGEFFEIHKEYKNVETLDYKRVSFYTAARERIFISGKRKMANYLKLAKITKYGIEMEVFDQVIGNMNRVQSDIDNLVGQIEE